MSAGGAVIAYDLWDLSAAVTAQCPDCDQESDEGQNLGTLLDWIDAHDCEPAL